MKAPYKFVSGQLEFYCEAKDVEEARGKLIEHLVNLEVLDVYKLGAIFEVFYEELETRAFYPTFTIIEEAHLLRLIKNSPEK